MSTRKTQIDTKVVLEFLKKEFDKNITFVVPLEGGEMSQAFSFDSGNGRFVIRVDIGIKAFAKDKYAFKHFSSDKIPIPEVIRMGKMNPQYYYAITKRVEGKILDHFSLEVIKEVLPELMRVLDNIHSVNIDTSKYGDWDENGKAFFNSWKEYLLSINDEQYFGWSILLKNSFMKEEVFTKAYEQIKGLINYCPEIRHLIHGDYGFNNLLTDGKKITGAIDWGESKYGDFLYDVAWLGFWTRDIDYEEEFYRHYKEENIAVPNYEKRLLCYKLYLGLSAAQFFVKSNQEKSYVWTKDRILSLLK